MRTKLLVLVVAATMFAGMAAVPTSAQAQMQFDEQVQPPRPGRSDSPQIFWTYLALLIILAAVFGANTIPSKRGHQD
jgi:hypothetical protein